MPIKDNKTKEEYIEEFNRLHDEFVHGKKEFLADDYSPLRKKKKSKSKSKRKTKNKK
jgi:hypothetical protein